MKFAGTVEQERAAAEAAGNPVAFVSAGDNVSASLFASAVQERPADDRRAQRARACRPRRSGNHEFDKGYADLTDRIIAGGTNATWDYLGANVYLKGTTTPALAGVRDPRHGRRQGRRHRRRHRRRRPPWSARAGSRSSTSATRSTRSTAWPPQLTRRRRGERRGRRARRDATTRAPAPARRTVRRSSRRSPPAARSPTSSTSTSPAVDAIFTGHTHKQYAWDGAGPRRGGQTRPIMQTGSYGENIGKVMLTYDPVTDEVIAHTADERRARTHRTAGRRARRRLPARRRRSSTIVDAALAYAEHGRLRARRVGHRGHHDGVLGRHVRSERVRRPGPDATTGRDDRASESTLGDLVANALRDTLAPANLGGAQIGVVNPGGLRAELLYAPGRLGHLRRGERVLPFVNNLWTTTLTGAQVKTMLEQQWQTRRERQRPVAAVPAAGPVRQRDLHLRRRGAAGRRTSPRSRSTATRSTRRRLPDRHVLVPDHGRRQLPVVAQGTDAATPA